jgi:ribosomal protein S27AE
MGTYTVNYKCSKCHEVNAYQVDIDRCKPKMQTCPMCGHYSYPTLQPVTRKVYL